MRESATFEEFWPEYVRAHRHPANRALHFVGTSAAIGCVAASVLTLHPSWLLAVPVVGYAPAWIGHFVFEKNKPATYEYPLWSLRADLKMLALAVRRVARIALRAAAPKMVGDDDALGRVSREP